MAAGERTRQIPTGSNSRHVERPAQRPSSRSFSMKVILSSILVALVLGAFAGVLLNEAQRPAYEVFSTSMTRVGNPGSNLVGPNWSGLNTEGDKTVHKTEP